MKIIGASRGTDMASSSGWRCPKGLHQSYSLERKASENGSCRQYMHELDPSRQCCRYYSIVVLYILEYSTDKYCSLVHSRPGSRWTAVDVQTTYRISGQL